ncbi:hypothetical protein ACPV56_14115 [Vibrio astriarenae]
MWLTVMGEAGQSVRNGARLARRSEVAMLCWTAVIEEAQMSEFGASARCDMSMGKLDF